MHRTLTGSAVLVLLACSSSSGNPAPQEEKERPSSQDLQPMLNGVSLQEITVMVQRKLGAKFLWTEDLGLNKKKVYYHADKLPEGKDGLFRLYHSFLQVNDLILVPSQGANEGDVVYKIQPLQFGPKRPTPLVRDSANPTDRFVTRVFPLKNVSPSAVHQALINMVTLPQGVFPIDSAGVLLITDYDYNIQRFEKIIAEMDKPKSNLVFEVIPLKYRDPVELEAILSNLVMVLLGSTSQRGPSETVKITADKGIKSLLILATAERMEQLKTIVEKIDIERK